MKITPTTDLGSAEKVQDARRSVRTDGEFGRVFQEELSQKASTSQDVTQQASDLSALSTMPVVPFSLGQIPATETGKVESTIQTTLDRLGQVEQLLHDAGVTPKTVDDAVHGLTAQAEELRHAMETMPAGHPLHQIAAEVSVLAAVESIKWKRGDYL
jgi:hypothetical protein